MLNKVIATLQKTTQKEIAHDLVKLTERLRAMIIEVKSYSISFDSLLNDKHLDKLLSPADQEKIEEIEDIILFLGSKMSEKETALHTLLRNLKNEYIEEVSVKTKRKQAPKKKFIFKG